MERGMEMNVIWFRQEIRNRWRNNGAIRQRVNSFIEKNYGIQDFSESISGNVDPSVGYMAMPVSLLTPNVETVAIWSLAQKLGFDLNILTRPWDIFSGNDWRKSSLAAMSWFDGSSNLEKTEFCSPDLGQVLWQITVPGARRTLQGYHLGLALDVFGTEGLPSIFDLSRLSSWCLSQAKINKPEEVYANLGGYAVIQPLEGTSGKISSIWPSLEWSWPLIISALLIQNGILFAGHSYNSKISGAIETVKKETGIEPLMVNMRRNWRRVCYNRYFRGTEWQEAFLAELDGGELVKDPLSSVFEDTVRRAIFFSRGT